MQIVAKYKEIYTQINECTERTINQWGSDSKKLWDIQNKQKKDIQDFQYNMSAV